MGIKRWIATAVLLPVVLGGGMLSASQASGASVEVLRLVAIEVDSTFLNLGDPGFSLGDQVVFTNDLFKRGTKVGKDGGTCTLVRLAEDGSASFQCLGTNELPDGQITVQGMVTYGPGEEIKEDPFLLAITGGTGAYKTAHGQVRVIEVSSQKLHLTFRIIR